MTSLMEKVLGTWPSRALSVVDYATVASRRVSALRA